MRQTPLANTQVTVTHPKNTCMPNKPSAEVFNSIHSHGLTPEILSPMFSAEEDQQNTQGLRADTIDRDTLSQVSLSQKAIV